MNLIHKPDPDRLFIFHEGRKRRVFVGEILYDRRKDRYDLIYDKNYARSDSAIPVGPNLDLFKLRHHSEKGKIFSALADRIPDKNNPAYKDYCKMQGISESEMNPIILLGTIGKRGPSSFIFELVYRDEFTAECIIKLREKLQITQHDLAEAFDISKATLQRIESGESRDINTIKLLQIMFTFPVIALWQLKQTGGRVHKDVREKLERYFTSKESSK